MSEYDPKDPNTWPMSVHLGTAPLDPSLWSSTPPTEPGWYWVWDTALPLTAEPRAWKVTERDVKFPKWQTVLWWPSPIQSPPPPK